MLIRGVVYDEIHYNLHASCMNSFEQLFELVESAVLLGDILVVGYIITHILLRRLIERREPDSVNAEAFYVIEL